MSGVTMKSFLLALVLLIVSPISWSQSNDSVTPQEAALADESEAESEARTAEEMTKEPAQELLAGEMQIPKTAETKSAVVTPAEAEIPVLTKATEKTAQSKNPMMRLVMSLGVILVVAGGLFGFSRFWAGRRTGLRQHHQIKVLTQFGLGPKKSLAIIRVAGESILIGITDHNINMIKSLALLDEELPDEVPTQFQSELQKQEHSQPQNIASQILAGAINEKTDRDDFSFGSVRDMVSSRLRNMRNL